MDIPSKVAHTKYAVAETRISGVKLITAIHVLKLLTMFLCIEFQISGVDPGFDQGGPRS